MSDKTREQAIKTFLHAVNEQASELPERLWAGDITITIRSFIVTAEFTPEHGNELPKRFELEIEEDKLTQVAGPQIAPLTCMQIDTLTGFQCSTPAGPVHKICASHLGDIF
ncbi:hypothetical protein ABZX12_18540 [Kribbella sp. NPDC003505]|uniref:hypothetical protein n=1 Tax=Kribbella sp. NPDC003505 TaxID=3154448 RepID=UPI0033B51558